MKKNLLLFIFILLLLATNSKNVFAGNFPNEPYINNYFSATDLNDSLVPPLRATFLKTGVSVCGCGKDGTINLAVTGGIAPYTYEWSGSNGYSAGNACSVYNLPIGYYNVTITDASQDRIFITGIHIDFAFSVQVTNSGSMSGTCGNSGTIILYGNAGIQPYTYSIDGSMFQCNNTFNGLAPGTYTAYVRDLAGCMSTRSITVGLADPLHVNPIARPSGTCSADGSVEIYLTGGVSPYLYSVDGITYQSSHTFQNLPAGNYNCYVKDSKGCIASQMVNLTQLSPVTVNLHKTNSSACASDGTIQVNAQNGQAPYTYSLNGTTFQTGNTFQGIAAGTYTVIAKDVRGCLGTANITIDLVPIDVTAYTTNAVSCAVANGKIQLYRTGGFGPYTYSLNGYTYQSSNVFNNIHAGVYTGFVKDSRSCVGTKTGIVIGPGNCHLGITKNAENDNDKTVQENGSLKMIIYPNPSSTDFQLALKGINMKRPVTIIVKDILGREVYHIKGMDKLTYTFGNNFKAGIYMIHISQGEIEQSFKLIKQ